MEQNEKNKFKWFVLLYIAISLFLIAMVTNQVVLNIITIVIAIYIYKGGQAILFKEYYDRRDKKLKESKVIRDAVKEKFSKGKLFRKK